MASDTKRVWCTRYYIPVHAILQLGTLPAGLLLTMILARLITINDPRRIAT